MPKNHRNLTQLAVERLKPPRSGRLEVWDSNLSGFGLRLSHTGLATWQVLYRVDGKQVREKLGTLQQLPKVADARNAARRSLAKARAGIDPVAERRAETAAAELPLDRERRPMCAEYLAETTRTLRHNVSRTPLGKLQLAELTADVIRRHVRALARTAPSQANHVLAYIKPMLAWAVEEGLLEKNPAAGLRLPTQLVERERALDDAEIVLFWRAAAAGGPVYGPFFKLLLLLGQRRDELARATWSELDVDRGIWALPGSRTKNGRQHVVHLSPLAIELLGTLPRFGRSGWVFSSGRQGDVPINGFGRPRLRVAAEMQRASETPIPGWTIHDLRRSCATGLAALSVAPHIVDKILNHSTGKISGVAKIYNRFEYLPERQAALEAWSRHIAGLLNPAPSSVIPLAR